MKIENIYIYNSYPAILGIRNTTKTWAKSDTFQIPVKNGKNYTSYNHADVGPKDRDLIERLMQSSKKSGRPNHRKFIRQIFVTFNLTAPKSFWSVFDSYKIGVDTSNSNTMQTIKKAINGERKFSYEDFEFRNPAEKKILANSISVLNEHKNMDIITTVLPQSFLLIKSWSGSYENLLQIYLDKHDSSFYQWKIVIETIKTLPLMSDLIIPNSVWE